MYKEAHHLQNTENGDKDICMTTVTNSEVNTAYSEVDTADSAGVSKLHVSSEKYNIIDILKNPELRIDTFILWYAW